MGVKVRPAGSHRCLLCSRRLHSAEGGAAVGGVLILRPLTCQHLLSLGSSPRIERHALRVCRKEGCCKLGVLVQCSAQLQLCSCKMFSEHLRNHWGYNILGLDMCPLGIHSLGLGQH